MKSSVLVFAGIILVLGCTIVDLLSADKGGLDMAKKGWELWRDGDVDEAENIARKLEESPEKRHLLFLCAFVKGDYLEAIGQYEKIDQSYENLKKLDEPAVYAYLHLHRYQDAEEFARNRKMKKKIQVLEMYVENPLKVSLGRMSVISFAQHPLGDYFPGFNVELNGKEIVAHVDTGGAFLHMGVERAGKLGIELMEGDLGWAALTHQRTYYGIAKHFRLGEAVLENVPVIALPTLKDQQDFVIFGTNILEQFLATLDYPDRRLILSPRRNEDMRNEHLTMLPAKRVEVPFSMWGSHFMFARGGFGEHKALNFFIDSGLVSLGVDSSGAMRQACFMATPDLYKKWGVDPGNAEKQHFESSLRVFLGSLEQKNQFFMSVKELGVMTEGFGGVRIDGLLSHAFLKEYSWTLDFDRHLYIFAQND